MDRVRREFLHPISIALCLSAFLAALNFFAPTPFYPQMARDLHTTVPRLGQVVTLMTVLSAGVGLVVGPLADRYGCRWPLVGGLLAIAAGLLGTGLAPTFPAVLGFGVVSGLGDALAFSLPFAIIATQFQGGAQRRAIGRTIGALSVAPIIGVPLLTALAGVSSWRIALAVAGLSALGVAWLVGAVLPVDGRRPTTPFSLWAWLGAYMPLLRHPGTLRILAVSFLRGVWWVGLLTYLGAFLGTVLGLGGRAVGLVYALVGAAYSLGSVAAGRGFGALPVRLSTALANLVGAALVGPMVLSATPGVVVPLVVVISVAAAACSVGIVTLLAAQSPAGAATTMVLNGSVLNLGSAGGAACCGLLIALGGYQLLAIGLPLFALAAAVLTWWPSRAETKTTIGKQASRGDGSPSRATTGRVEPPAPG